MAGDVVCSGMSGRFPRSDTIDEFWDNLVNKVDMVTKDRVQEEFETYPTALATMKTLRKFDAAFFGASHTAADALGAAQRILYEVVYEAIMDAGYNPETLRGKKIGVYVGTCSQDRQLSTITDRDSKGVLTWGSYRLSNTVSFMFDFKGPSVTMDSACSTALSAMTMAFGDLRSGACDRAIVAATHVSTNVHEFDWFKQMTVISEGGVSKIFDEGADGFVPGEAVVAILLEPKSIAKRSYGDIVSSVVGHDGFKGEGLTFPSLEAQKEMLHECYAKANLKINDIAYFECHGTGTRAGDMVEGNAVGEALTAGRPDPLLIGSVKSNCGHHLGSATLSSVIKVLLMSHRRLIPANLNYEKPNPNVPHLSDGRLQVVLDTMPFNGGIVGINAFGIGGSNGHIIVNCPLKDSDNFRGKKLKLSNIPRLVPVCGRNEESLNHIVDFVTAQHNSGELTEDFLALLSGFTKATPGGGLNARAVLKLKKNEEITKVVGTANRKRPVWLIMSGMGAQWPAMAKDLMRFEVFANTINKCHQVISSLGIDLLHSITSEDASVLNAVTSLVAIASIQAALIDLIKLLEIKYDGLIGFSMGELACAYFEDCITLEQYMRAAFWRSQCVVDCENLEPGLMAAVGLSPEEAGKRCPEGVLIACHISDEMVTIAGEKDIMLPFMEELKKEEIFVREVDSGNVANHHKDYLERPAVKLREEMDKLFKSPKERSAKWISSSVAEEQLTEGHGKFASSDYFVNNFVSPVLFNEALKKCPKDAIILEIGPHMTMRGTVMKTLGKNVQYSCLMTRNCPNSFDKMFDELARLYILGVNLEYENLYPKFNFPVALDTPSLSPLLKWDHSKDWSLQEFPLYFNPETAADSFLNIDVSNFADAYLTGHTIDGRVLYPASGYLKLAWDAASLVHTHKCESFPVVFEDIVFIRATVLKADRKTRLACRRNALSGHFTITADGDTVCTGIVKRLEIENNNSITKTKFNLIKEQRMKKEENSLTSKEFYRELRVRGYHYKDQFQGVESAAVDGSSAMIRWTAHSNWTTFIDCCFQFPILNLPDRQLRVPTRIGKLTIDATNFKPVNEGLINVVCDRVHGTVSSEEILIERFEATAIARNPFPKVISEKVEFVPYFDNEDENWEVVPSDGEVQIVDKENLIRPFVEIIAENTFARQLDMIDLTSERHGDLVSESLKSSFILVNDVKEENCQLILLETGKNKLLRKFGFEQVSKHLTKKGFLMVVVNQDYEPDVDLEELYEIEKLVAEANLIEISEKRTGSITIKMFRKADEINFNKENLIFTSTDDFEWVEKAKQVFADNTDNVWFLASEEINGMSGFINCLRREPNGHRIRCLVSPRDLEKSNELDVESGFFKKLLSSDLVMNVFENDRVGRYCRYAISEQSMSHPVATAIGVGTKGDLSSIHWRESRENVACVENPSEIIDVHYLAINFRDVMLALGRIPPDDGGILCLSREYSGVRRDGKRVMGATFRNGVPTSFVPDETNFSLPVPDHWTLEEAATVPVVYMTALYGLLERGHLKKGESILIHAGAGGVGQAAINIAQSYGCKIYTTVGSQEKRDFLKNTFGLKDDEIFNSRDINFEEEIMTQTNGRGVDMVLNSLAGEKLIASVRCLADSGRFIEIGKADILSNNKLGMAMLLRNIAFHVVNLETKIPGFENVAEVFRQKIDAGEVKPIVRTVFNHDQVEDAFRYITASKHIGKVLVKVREENEDPKMLLKKSTYFFTRKSYIIIGGLGGFGLELVDWMVDRGARMIVVTSRKGATEAYQEFVINRARRSGCHIVVKTDDVSTKEGARNVIESATQLAPIGGVFNLALVLRDAIFENQSKEQFEEVCAAKVNGTKNLDELTRDMKLDHFVCFSSISSGLGNPGQTNYGFANSVMERVCERRRKDGLSGTAIQWGVVGDVGVLADSDTKIQHFAPQKIVSCLDTLDKLLNCSDAITGSHVIASKEGNDNKINSSDPIELIAHVMGARNASEIDQDTKLEEMGMNSMMAVEIQQILEDYPAAKAHAKNIRKMTIGEIKELLTTQAK